MHREINKNARGHSADPLYRALRLSGTDLLTGGLGTRSSTTRTYVFSILGRKYGLLCLRYTSNSSSTSLLTPSSGLSEGLRPLLPRTASELLTLSNCLGLEGVCR